MTNRYEMNGFKGQGGRKEEEEEEDERRMTRDEVSDD